MNKDRTVAPERKILGASSPIPGHLIPALKLGLMLKREQDTLHMISYGGMADETVKMFGASPRLLPDGHIIKRISRVKKMLNDFRPEISVCDWSIDLWLALRPGSLMRSNPIFSIFKTPVWRPRCTISVLRCELIKGYIRRNMFLPDKFGLDSGEWTTDVNDLLKLLKLPGVNDVREIPEADIIVIPSIPQLDPVSDTVREDYPSAKFVYTGPLLLQAGQPITEQTREWIDGCHRDGKPIVLITLGTEWGAWVYQPLIMALKDSGFGLFVVVPDANIRSRLEHLGGSNVVITGFTNLQECIRFADVVVHHCGHSTSQAVLAAGKPSVTLPTGEYDREDNALRLEEMECGIHLGHDFFRNGLQPASLTAALRSVLNNTTILNGVNNISRIVNEYINHRGSEELNRLVAERLK